MGERRREEPEKNEQGRSRKAPPERKDAPSTSELPEEERRGTHDPADFSPDDFE